MKRRVLLHVGTPKSGTSYLQDVLFQNRQLLVSHNILYPADRFDAQFLAALDLMQLPWGGLEEEARGRWAALAEEVRAWPGTSIVSHEVFAFADRQQAERAIRDLGGDVEIIISARDLVRQIPAEWQENIKHRRTFSYQSFLELIQNPKRTSRTGSWFWAVQELPDILARWGSTIEPSKVHVVTVPRPGSPPTLLWERFESAFGLAEVELMLEVDRSNPSLGSNETALLRRINRRFNKHLRPADYRPLVRELLAHVTLSQRTSTPRLSLPPEAEAWAAGLCREWVAELTERGYHVVGDINDLLAEPIPVTWADPDQPDEAEVGAAALDVIGVLLDEVRRLREIEGDLGQRLEETERALELSYLRPSYKLREQAVQRLEHGRVGQRMLGVYRRARGRNSR